MFYIKSINSFYQRKTAVHFALYLTSTDISPLEMIHIPLNYSTKSMSELTNIDFNKGMNHQKRSGAVHFKQTRMFSSVSQRNTNVVNQTLHLLVQELKMLMSWRVDTVVFSKFFQALSVFPIGEREQPADCAHHRLS